MAEQYPDAIMAEVLFDLNGKTAAEVVIEMKKRLHNAGFVIERERSAANIEAAAKEFNKQCKENEAGRGTLNGSATAILRAALEVRER